MFNSAYQEPKKNSDNKNSYSELSQKRSRAESIVQLAQKKGQLLIKQAKITAEHIKKRAHKEGFQEGFEEGIERGCQRGEEEFKNKTENIIKKLLEGEMDYENHLKNLLMSLEPRIIDMITIILKTILKREVEKDEELVIRTIKDAVKNLHRRDKVLITAHRLEVEKIIHHSQEIIQSSDLITDLEVVPGENIEKGGAMIISSDGSIDAKFTSQMEVISDIINN